MLHNRFKADRIFSRWKVRPSYGESATTYFASLVADSEDCTPKTFAQQNGLLSGPNPSLPILDALLRLPLTDDEKAGLIRWTPMRFPELQSWRLCGHHIAGKRFAEIGRHCPDCIKEAAFHRVWWDLQGFATCPIHDTPLTKFKRPDNNEYVRFTFHGIAQNKITSPPVLSARGRDSYEGYLLQTLGAVEGSTSRPLLDDQPLDLRIRVIQMVGRFLSNPKATKRNPSMRPTSMVRGFDALKHDQTYLEDQFSNWLVANHSPVELRHAKLDHFGYLQQMPLLDGSMKDRIVAAKLSAAARHGTLTPVLRTKPGVDVPLHLSGLAKETSLTRYSLIVLLRIHWPNMPETGVLEIPREIADQVRSTAQQLVPQAHAAKLLRCSATVARSIARLFSLDGKIVAVSQQVGRRTRLHYIKSHLDWMMGVLDALELAPTGVRTVGLRTYARHHMRGEARVLVDVLEGRRKAFRGSTRELSKLLFERPPKSGRGGKPSPIGRTHVPEGGMLGCEFLGITGADATAALELVKQGFIKKFSDKRGLLDRASVLAFHERYVNPVRYLMGRGMIAIDAIWALKKMDLPLAFEHPTIRPYFAERKELEARIGPLDRPSEAMMDRWRELIRQGGENCPSFIIPEVPGDGPTYVYTSSRMFSFRVLFEEDALVLRARFTPDARRIWTVYRQHADVFKVLLESFRWRQSGDEITATARVSTDDQILKATVELGKLAAYFRHKMP